MIIILDRDYLITFLLPTVMIDIITVIITAVMLFYIMSEGKGSIRANEKAENELREIQ